MKKRFDIKEWQDSRMPIKEDGGTYETTIFIQDAGDSVYVLIEDNQGEKNHESFTGLKGAYDYILEYINQWDLS